MSRQENSFRDSETGVVRGETIRQSEATSDFPQVRKQRPADGRGEIGRAARTTSSWLHAYRPFDHLGVPVPPFLQALVKIHETLAELRVLRVAAVDVDENLLHFG